MTVWWQVAAIAVVGGLAVTLQGQFMGLLSRRLGDLEAVLITYGGGGLTIGLLMLVWRGGSLAALTGAPWYTYTNGVLGLVIVGAIGYTAARLGLVATFTIMLASQFVLAVFLDHLGWLGAIQRPLDWSRLAGIVVLLIGVWLTIR
jgi:bacterial/archaeal transporter family-2 protein